ncbi:MAG: TauD/TfdA family dioxygenase [Alphaproteobacteria bacterium]
MPFTPPLPDHPMPLSPAVPEDRSVPSALAWAKENADEIQAAAGSAGVVLIRGFDIDTPEAFRAVCQAIEPDLRTYTGGDSPRTGVTDKVYTSTEYDPSLEVFLHNELSYAGWSPRLVFFCCLVPALEGGETPVADGRLIYKTLPADLRDRFEKRGIAYLQHLWDEDGAPGIGKSWQQTFETSDRQAVEDYLRQSTMTWEWTDFGIRTRAPHPAVIAHPQTGEACWRNQADQWHRGFAGVKTSFGGADDPRFDAATAGEETLGNHVTYGDGSEIDIADLETVRRVNQSVEVAFPWQAGDVMVIDNILAMHGRKPYRGPRRVLVAMA